MSVRLSRKLLAATVAAAAAALLIAPVGLAAVAAPKAGTPCAGTAVDMLPPFTWSAAASASSYEFQIASDPNFTTLLFPGSNLGDVVTKNTRVALQRTIPNGAYYWRVRGLGSSGGIGAWSATCQFQMNWNDAPQQVSPTDGQALTYPTPLLFNWNSATGATSYKLTVSSSADLSNPQIDHVQTNATQYSPSQRLPSGTYYWSVSPVDPEGNVGQASPIHSFSWDWPAGATTLSVTDLDPSDEVYDPEFSWTAIPGAATYDLQITAQLDGNQNPDFSQRICCDGSNIVSTTYSPSKLLPANTYYWRIRAVDSTGNPGPWVLATQPNSDPLPFVDNYATNGVSNLRVIDTTGATVPGLDPTVDTPIIAWDPTPGAADYEVQVGNWSGVQCDFSGWDDFTASTAWTPLGNGGAAAYSPTHGTVASDGTPLAAGQQYCVRVRPFRDNDITGSPVHGGFTQLGGTNAPAFTFSDYPTGNPCTAPCNPVLNIGAGDYNAPLISGTSTLPVFSWKPISGVGGYLVIVATNSTFNHVVDEAFTRIPAYAPRLGGGPINYTGSASYAYAVLPTQNSDGSGAAYDPTSASSYPQTFSLPINPPVQASPADGAVLTGQPTFQWSAVQGALAYRVSVSADPTFPTSGVNSTQTFDVSGTSFTATSFPAATKFYWRVQGIDKSSDLMAYSTTRSFLLTPPVPNFVGITNPSTADGIPVLEWNAAPGAVSYDVWMTTPSNAQGSMVAQNIDTTAYTPTQLQGTGTFTWKVEAEYATGSGRIVSAWSPVQSFTRTEASPQNATATVGGAHSVVVTWTPKAQARLYQIAFASNSSFTQNVDQFQTDTTSATPLLANDLYTQGGTIYWRVQSQDQDGNWSAWSTVKTLNMPILLTLSVSGGAQKGKTSTIKVTAKTGVGTQKPVSGVTIKKTGCGLKASSVKTGSAGGASFSVKPPKGNCNITFTATKTGAVSATITSHVY